MKERMLRLFKRTNIETKANEDINSRSHELKVSSRLRLAKQAKKQEMTNQKLNL